MANFVMILICLFLGIVFRQRKIFPESTAHVLNRFIIYISLPALTLKEVHRLPLSVAQMPAMAMSWIVFLLSLLFFLILQRQMRWPSKTLGALILTAGFGNTSFVGFALLQTLYGDGALATGIFVDQPGTFFAVGTLGILTASILSSQELTLSAIVRRVAYFPPIQAMILAIVLKGYVFPNEVMMILEKLSATLIPLAIVAVGFQLRFDREYFRREWRSLALGLGFKMIFAPALIYLLYVQVLHLHGPDIQIILADAGMAPMITAGIVVAEYGLNAELGSLMVGLGTPLSLLTVPIWAQIFSGV
jgi:predicted permease